MPTDSSPFFPQVAEALDRFKDRGDAGHRVSIHCPPPVPFGLGRVRVERPYGRSKAGFSTTALKAAYAKVPRPVRKIRAMMVKRAKSPLFEPILRAVLKWAVCILERHGTSERRLRLVNLCGKRPDQLNDLSPDGVTLNLRERPQQPSGAPRRSSSSPSPSSGSSNEAAVTPTAFAQTCKQAALILSRPFSYF